MSAVKSSSGKVHMSMIGVTLIVLISATRLIGAESEPGSVGQSGDGGDSGSGDQSFAPKRQYFIAPRIGRSLGGAGPNAIWSALEEGSFQTPGQVQSHLHGFPGPLKSSLLFLIGNRRLRSPAPGLMPQARIGRRAGPSGLLPQPRVGRRSAPTSFGLAEGPSDQEEVAMAAMSDNSALNEAFESLVNAVLVATFVVVAVGASDKTMERPIIRAGTTKSSFVPRLGKRTTQTGALGRLLCAQSSECSQMALIESIARSLLSNYAGPSQYLDDLSPMAVSSESQWNLREGRPTKQSKLLVGQGGESFIEDLLDGGQQQVRRENRASRASGQEENNARWSEPDSGFGGSNMKRVAFTPRIGR